MSSKPPVGQQGAEPAVAGVPVAEIAKWLVPSITVLFGVVGFIAQTAQDALLGLSSDPDSTRYVTSAADFFTGVLNLLVQEALKPWDISFAGLFWWLMLATALTAAAIALPQLSARLGLHKYSRIQVYARSWLLPALVAILVIVKFIDFDAPLFEIHHVVLGLSAVGVDSTRTPAGGGDLGKTFGERLARRLGKDAGSDAAGDTDKGHARKPGPTDGNKSGAASAIEVDDDLVSERTWVLWNEMVCSRIGDRVQKMSFDVIGLDCSNAPQAVQEQDLEGEFLDVLWLTVLIAAMALSTLRSRHAGHGTVVLAILALLYTLTLPYDYGKLLKSTFHDSGRVRLQQFLLAGLPARHRPMAPPASNQSQQQIVNALILTRSAASVELLVVKEWPCDGQWGFAGQRVVQASLPSAQVLAVEQIYSRDVISWVMLHQLVARPDNRCQLPSTAPKT